MAQFHEVNFSHIFDSSDSKVYESTVKDLLIDLCLKVNDGCIAQHLQCEIYFGRYSESRDEICKFVLPEQPPLAHEFMKLLDLAEFVERAESLL